MNKPFYVFSVYEKDGVVKKSVYDFATYDEAEQSYYSTLGKHINSSIADYVMACLINEGGVMLESKFWRRPEEEPEEAPAE